MQLFDVNTVDINQVKFSDKIFGGINFGIIFTANYLIYQARKV